jgi:hypothetical protein
LICDFLNNTNLPQNYEIFKIEKEKYFQSLSIKQLKNKNMESEKIPETLDEAVDLIISNISEDDLQKLKQMDYHTFIGHIHMFFGRGLRNDWHLWFNDNALTEYFTSIGINHGDDRSGIILQSVFNKVNGLPINIEGQVAKYKQHWLEYGFKDGIFPVPISSGEYQKIKYK